METRANHVWVGAVTLALLALLAAFFVWLVQLGGDDKEYEIFFPQSVGGLASGSAVTYSGVPVGQVVLLELWRKDPAFVEVRIEGDAEAPNLGGSTGPGAARCTGVSTLSPNG